MPDLKGRLKAALRSRSIWAILTAACLAAITGLILGSTWDQRLLVAASLSATAVLLGGVLLNGRQKTSDVYARLDARIRKIDQRTTTILDSIDEKVSALADEKRQVPDRDPKSPIRSVRPRVTVVTTTYNQAGFVKDAIRSIRSQTWTDFECILVDAHSTDSTLDEAFDEAESDPRFDIVSLDRNDGPSVARNTGLLRARGEYVTFLDGDDFLYPGALEQRLLALASEHDGAWVAGSYCLWHPVPEDSPLLLHPPQGRDRSDVTWFNAVTGAPFIVSAPVIRRDVLLAHRGFDESIPSGEDAHLWARLLRAGWVIRCSNTVGVAYRQRRRSWYRVSRAEHSDYTNQIVRSNTAPCVPSLIGPGPYPYRQDYATLTAERSEFERALIELVGALDTHSKEAVDEALQTLSKTTEPWMPRVVDVRSVVHRAAVRLTRFSEDGLQVRTRELQARALNHLAPMVGTSSDTGMPQSNRRHLETAERITAIPSGVLLKSITTVPWSPARSAAERTVLLLPGAAYHLDELIPLARELENRGLEPHYLVSSKRWNNVKTGLRRSGSVPVSVYNPDRFDGYEDVVANAVAVVAMNDWGEDRPLLEIAKAVGIPGFAKVEGVQDFEDADIDRHRRAYQTAEFILAQGPNDLANTRPAAFTVGSTRLERIWREPEVVVGEPRAVINLNFTYGVLNEARDLWLATAAAACRTEGIPYVVSVHPAERATLTDEHPVADQSIKHELTRSTVLISRFSTVPFEAMARGIPFIYHNPHGERVPTFAHSGGAFPSTSSVNELRAALREVADWVGSYRQRSAKFFRAQVDIDSYRPSEIRTAGLIAAMVAGESVVPDREADDVSFVRRADTDL